MGSGTTHRASAGAAANSWGCGSVRWKQVMRYQSHGGWVVLLCACVVLAISHFKVKPDFRPLTAYDASISLPNKPDTVSIQLAGIIPMVALLLTVAAVEFGALWKRQSLTMAIHAFCHIIWWAIIGFAVVLAITEATKPWASRYRPDYMARCQPSVQSNKPLTFKQQTDCASSVKNTDFVKDGRKSFPSGHSSNSLSLCWFTILYLVHALYWREGMAYLGSFMGGSKGCGRRLMGEVLQGIFILWGLVVISIAWCIGVTRFRDNRHNIDDILGGFMAALLWMTPCVLIALGQLNYYQQELRKQEEEGLPLTNSAGGAAVDNNNYNNDNGFNSSNTPSGRMMAAPGQTGAPARGDYAAARADAVSPAQLDKLTSINQH